MKKEFSNKNAGGLIYDVYLIADALSQARQRWTKVGIGFLNRDYSINVILDALPVNGKLHLRERGVPGEERDAADHKG